MTKKEIAMEKIKNKMKFFKKLPPILGILFCLPANTFAEPQSPANTDGLIQAIEAASDPCKEIEQYAERAQNHAIEPLINALKNQRKKPIQACIATTLAKIDVNKSVDILINSLNDKNLLAASRCAFALGIIKDKRAVGPLIKALFESNIPCPAAEALGRTKDPEAFDALVKALHNGESGIRGCAVEGLIFYGDPKVCETLTDVFMADTDENVKGRARRAKEILNCPAVDKNTAKYAIGADYCSSAQQLIDFAWPLINKTEALKEGQTYEWQETPEWNNRISKIFAPFQNAPSEMTPEEEKEFMLRYSISMLAVKWVEHVMAYRLEPENQSLYEPVTKSTCLLQAKDTTEQLKQLCPSLKVPNYEH